MIEFPGVGTLDFVDFGETGEGEARVYDGTEHARHDAGAGGTLFGR